MTHCHIILRYIFFPYRSGFRSDILTCYHRETSIKILSNIEKSYEQIQFFLFALENARHLLGIIISMKKHFHYEFILYEFVIIAGTIMLRRITIATTLTQVLKRKKRTN